MRTRGLNKDGIYHTLQKILLGFVLVFCFVTVAGALDVFTSMSIGADDNRVLLFAFEIFFSFLNLPCDNYIISLLRIMFPQYVIFITKKE